MRSATHRPGRTPGDSLKSTSGVARAAPAANTEHRSALTHRHTAATMALIFRTYEHEPGSVDSFNCPPASRHHTPVTPDTHSAAQASGYAESVIDACRRGERAALTQVFRCEAPYLERVLFRVVRVPSDVEDLLQLTLEQAIRAFPSFRGEAGVRTWLTRIAVRTAMHHLRHPAVRRRAELTLVEGGHAEQEQEVDASTARVEARSSLRVLHEHIAALEPVQRMAFILFQIEGRSMEEVAALMESGISTTKSRVMWARRRLFERLQKDPRGRELLAVHGGDLP